MLRAQDFRLISAQVVLFLSDPKAFSQPQFLATMLGHFAGRYDGPVQALPFQDDVAAEIPRVILQSQDGQWKLQASLNRIDSFWFSNDLSTQNIDIITDCVEVLRKYMETFPHIQITRLGFVVRHLNETENPAGELIDHFCNPKVKATLFNASESFEILNHEKYKLRNTPFTINSLVRCQSGMISNPSKKGTIVEQDINTIEGDMQNQFALENVLMFYEECKHEIEYLLQKYFS
jgi:hypothetical protein